MGKPLDQAKYICRHGMSYSVYECDYNGIYATQKMSVAMDDPVEIWDVKIRNTSDRPRKISAFSYLEFSFHQIAMDNQNFQMSMYASGSFIRKRGVTVNVYKNKKPAWVFLLPAFLFMAVFLYYPFLQNIANSFMKIRNLGGGAKGVNNPFYKNYAELLTDPNVRVVLKNTVIMIFVTLFGEAGLAVILAMLVDNVKRGTRFFRIVYFFPIVVSATVLGITGALKVFDLPWGMFPNGAPLGKTWLTGTYLYYKTMQAPDIDYSSAIAFFIVILGVILSKVVNKIFKEDVEKI